MADARVLKILLGDVLVGHLTGFQDGKNLFAFDDSYINLGPSRPILRLIFDIFPNRFEQVAEFIRRLVVNILIGNGDAHLKNWSVI